MSWLLRGAQSAAFYYISCTPCYATAYRRRQKKENKKHIAAIEALSDTEDGGTYHQPPPLHTNAFWEEEITLGPSLPWGRNKKRGRSLVWENREMVERERNTGEDIHGTLGDNTESKKRSKSQRKSRSQSRRGFTGEKKRSRACSANSLRQPTAGQGSSTGSKSSQNTTLVGSERPGSKQSNPRARSTWAERAKKRYQRPDEILWGITRNSPTSHPLQTPSSRSSTHLSHPQGSVTGSRTSVNSQRYDLGRNPVVNDLSPPVVSTHAASAHENLWMLQPPPPAKIMEGKVKETSMRAGRGRSISATKGRSTSQGWVRDGNARDEQGLGQWEERDFAPGTASEPCTGLSMPAIAVVAPDSEQEFEEQREWNWRSPTSSAFESELIRAKSSAGEKGGKRPALSPVVSERSVNKGELKTDFRFPALAATGKGGREAIFDDGRLYDDRDVVRQRWSMDI